MTLYAATITLILVMDPLGNIPIFLSVLRRYDPKTQYRILIRETAIAFLILIIFLFFGRYILHGLQITTSALSVAGGIILFIIAIRMIFPTDKGQEDLNTEPFIVPLAVPLTAGPSAIAMVMLFVTRDPGKIWTITLSVVIATAVFLIIMLAARSLMRVLGKRGLIAIERLMGMILTTIAVQMFLSGVSAYLQNPHM